MAAVPPAIAPIIVAVLPVIAPPAATVIPVPVDTGAKSRSIVPVPPVTLTVTSKALAE
jgi:hypothetical protein